MKIVEKRREEIIRRLSAEYLVLRNLIQELRRRAELLNRLLIEIDDTLSSLESVKELKEGDKHNMGLREHRAKSRKELKATKEPINLG